MFLQELRMDKQQYTLSVMDLKKILHVFSSSFSTCLQCKYESFNSKNIIEIKNLRPTHL